VARRLPGLDALKVAFPIVPTSVALRGWLRAAQVESVLRCNGL